MALLGMVWTWIIQRKSLRSKRKSRLDEKLILVEKLLFHYKNDSISIERSFISMGKLSSWVNYQKIKVEDLGQSSINDDFFKSTNYQNIK